MTNPENNQPEFVPPIARFARAFVEFKERPARTLMDHLLLSERQQAQMVGMVACCSGYCTEEMVRLMRQPYEDKRPEQNS